MDINVATQISHPSVIELTQCADCNADEPDWAVINRGVLICSDCCTVHRNLGRHISQVRSLKKGIWDTPQLELVKLLHRLGSNKIWEHILLDPATAPKSKKKPNAHDPVVPTKESFIKAKYADHAYTIRPNKDDDTNMDDLNKQLWSCVRTSHVDTTLRLLALGADPNYADPVGGNTPMHIAAKEGQTMQVELLFIYGADPNAPNAAEQNPSKIALQEGFTELSERLDELCFEITNRMSLFLCGRKPEHKKNQHFMIPELTGKSVLDGLRTSRRQLQKTTNSQFEKIAQDVYDELDRRETQTAWIAHAQGRNATSANEMCIAVFLPLNPAFSATRNQLRQKLAKYDAREFAALLIDILKESRRRFNNEPVEEEFNLLETSQNNPNNTSTTSAMLDSTVRDYDDVADFNRSNIRASGTTRSSEHKTRSSGSLEGPSDSRISLDDFLELRERLTDQEEKVKHLTSTSTQMLKIMSQLQSTVEHIRADNSALKAEVIKLNEQLCLARRLPSPATVAAQAPQNGAILTSAPAIDKSLLQNKRQPVDPMLENRARRQGSITGSTSSGYRPIPSGRMSADHHRELEEEMKLRMLEQRGRRDNSREIRERAREIQISQATEGDYATVSPIGSPPARNVQDDVVDRGRPMDDVADTPPLKTQTPYYSDANQENQFNETKEVRTSFQDNFIRETERLTIAIRELLVDAQHQRLDNAKAADHAHKIAIQINQIILLIPAEMRHGKIETTIEGLKKATMLLGAKCNAPHMDSQETCHAAYNVAQEAKNLLVFFND